MVRLTQQSIDEQLEARVDELTGPGLRDQLYQALYEARPLLGPALFNRVESAISAERVAVTEASFVLGFQAATNPAAWLFDQAALPADT